ncbi:MAG: YraN family protein [Defluviitaleaceae bacterium]|nr:YraN family protein [Defluviitaleaceae bacterium]
MQAPKDRRKLGRIGEDIAADYLACKGYRVLARNYRRNGAEIDIICRESDGCLVFVEVKSRTYSTFGQGFEAVGHTKQARIVQASMSYISEHNITDDDIRYDVISITLGGGDSGNSIEHIPNAFDAR